MKYCPRCETAKPVDDFYVNRSNRDGRQSYCKPCEEQRKTAWRLSNPEKYKAWRRRVNKRHADKRLELGRRWVADNPEKRRAQVALQRAVATGRVFRPGACSNCGRSDVRPEAHHDDYSKPLEVRWLCSSCHRTHHYAEKVA